MLDDLESLTRLPDQAKASLRARDYPKAMRALVDAAVKLSFRVRLYSLCIRYSYV